MATKDKQDKAKQGAKAGGGARPDAKQGKGGGGGKGGERREGGQRAQRGAHPNAGQPAPAPRLRLYYQSTVRDRLMRQFALTNPHQVPTLEKIVINCGVGEA